MPIHSAYGTLQGQQTNELTNYEDTTFPQCLFCGSRSEPSLFLHVHISFFSLIFYFILGKTPNYFLRQCHVGDLEHREWPHVFLGTKGHIMPPSDILNKNVANSLPVRELS